MARARSGRRRHWLLATWSLLLSPLLCAPLWGCDDSSVVGDLSLRGAPAGGGPLRVDDVCSPQCVGEEKIDVHVVYKSTGGVQQDKIEILQYRVDYTLPGLVGTIPFYGAKTGFEVAPGETKDETFVVVGSVQRDFVRQATSGAPVTGTAKLTIAGYDADNRQVFLETGFNIRFSDETAPVNGATANDAGAGDAK